MPGRETTEFDRYMDFTKALAITIIFFFHFNGFVLNTSFRLEDIAGLKGRPGIMYLVFYGITALGKQIPIFFFIASGYGLYKSHLRRPRLWKDFYMHRFVRVLPLYWLVLITVYFRYHGHFSTEAFWPNLLLYQTYTKHWNTFVNMWFVGYIVQLYLAFPLLAYLFRNIGNKGMILLCSFVFPVLYEWAFALFSIEPVGIPPAHYLPSFVFGMFMAEGFDRRAERALPMGALYNAAAFVVFAIYTAASIRYGFFRTSYGENLSFILLFAALYPVFSSLSRSTVFVRASDAIAYGSYVTFLIHILVYSNLLELLYALGVLTVNKGGLAKYMVLGSTGLMAPLGVVMFIFCAACSWYVQKAYDVLSRRALRRLRPA